MKKLLGPSAPRFWQRLQWIFDPISYLENAEAQFPDIFQANSLGFGGSDGNIVLTSHPQALQQLLTSDSPPELASEEEAVATRILL
jgi:unspecific monooxygenase